VEPRGDQKLLVSGNKGEGLSNDEGYWALLIKGENGKTQEQGMAHRSQQGGRVFSPGFYIIA